MAEKQPKTENLSVEDRLTSLYKLQTIVSEIDRIRQIRGDLPLEVKEIDDNIAGLKTRKASFEAKIDQLKKDLAQQNTEIQEAKTKIERYNQQLDNVRNNREYDSINKEIEYQHLVIVHAEKKIEENNRAIAERQKDIEHVVEEIEDKQQILEDKKGELAEIVSETKQDEERLRMEARKLEPQIDERTLAAFKRIRQNARNGLGIVSIQRDACGGCYNRIPPQKQLEIKMHKKVIVCEYCGRILIDPALAGDQPTEE